VSIQQTARLTTDVRELRVVTAAETRPSILHYQRLEEQSWAPWLRFTRSVLAEHVRSFPSDQFFAYDETGLVGALSTNRISWSGDPADLASWDAVAGERQDYKDTHVADGNTLVTLSMSIATRSRGSGVAGRLLDAVRASARVRGIEHVIGSYRPPGYGSHKLRHHHDFLTYAGLRNEQGLPVDPWLRVLTRMGMTPLKIDERAMVVDVSLPEFEQLRRASASVWVRSATARDAALHQPALPFPVVECEPWETEQAGTWYVHQEAARAVYVESGVWGEVVLDGQEA
jgi:GNAT superfamily N-acetyltransferase